MEENKMFEKYDNVIGTTTCASSKGTFVELVGGQIGWISRVHLPSGVSVICTVYGIKEDGFPILNLDSVRYQEAA